MSVLPIGLTFVKSFLITGETQELVLVDAGTPGDGDRIADRIRELGYRLEDVALIVLTHGHSDHVGGVRRLKELTHAEILIHSRDAGILQEGIESPVVPLGARGRFLRLFTGLTGQKSDYTEGVDPDCLIDEKFNLKTFGIGGEIIHTPGHTPGSLSVLLEDGTAIVGDLIMGSLLVLGRASLPVFATSREELTGSIRKVLDYSPHTIYSSHGGPYRPEDVRRLC